MTTPKRSRAGRPRGQNVENASRRKKQLLDATISSIAEHGLSSTTLGTVARASGLSQGTVVFYFKNKEALLDEAFRVSMEDYKTICMAAIAAAGTDPVDRLVAMAFASLDPDLISSQNLMFWNAFWPEASNSKTLYAAFEAHETERQTTMLALCEEAGALLSGTRWTPRDAALAIENMIEGIWVRLYYSSEHMTIEDARLSVALVLASIFPAREADIMKHIDKPKVRDT